MAKKINKRGRNQTLKKTENLFFYKPTRRCQCVGGVIFIGCERISLSSYYIMIVNRDFIVIVVVFLSTTNRCQNTDKREINSSVIKTIHIATVKYYLYIIYYIEPHSAHEKLPFLRLRSSGTEIYFVHVNLIYIYIYVSSFPRFIKSILL